MGNNLRYGQDNDLHEEILHKDNWQQWPAVRQKW